MVKPKNHSAQVLRRVPVSFSRVILRTASVPVLHAKSGANEMVQPGSSTEHRSNKDTPGTGSVALIHPPADDHARNYYQRELNPEAQQRRHFT